ncbi:MAG: DUF2793 domain-containing protein [Pseudomonadota bacterium]
MTDTANLGLPFIEGSQAQKHVTHNEALRILDAVIQVAVRDTDRSAPPASPDEGDRHIVAAAPAGAWAGHATTIATWEDGAWRFLVPHTGWIAWSIADDVLFVFDGTAWRDLRELPVLLDDILRIGVNTPADMVNRLSVRSNAVLLNAIATGDGGSGDVRLQMSKEGPGNTASVVFSSAFSGRAEFGLIGSDAFKLKVSPDGSSFTDSFVIDQASGNLTLPKALSLTGVISPAQITSDQNDYAPAGFSSASVLRISTDAVRQITGLAGGGNGRIVHVMNVGAFAAVLKDENTASLAGNRFAPGSDLTLAPGQGAVLLYDGVSSRWRPIAGSAAGGVTSLNGATGAVTTGLALQNASLAVSASGGALTIALKDAAGNDPSPASPCVIGFRNAAGPNGTGVTVPVTAATSLVVSSGSTLGVTSSTGFRLWVVGFNDGGTFRLGVINCSTYSAGTFNVYPLSEYTAASSTAEGGAGGADSAGVFYTGTAVAAKAYRILGFIEWGASGLTAGTWTTTNLVTVQAFGPGTPRPGDVVQQFNTQSNSTTTTTSTSFTSTGISAAITPRSAANPIRISFSGGGDCDTQGNTLSLDVDRGGTSLAGVFGRDNVSSAAKQGASSGVIPQSFAVHDRPNSTSALTYTLQWKTTSGTATLGARNGGALSQPTCFGAQEIMG